MKSIQDIRKAFYDITMDYPPQLERSKLHILIAAIDELEELRKVVSGRL